MELSRTILPLVATLLFACEGEPNTSSENPQNEGVPANPTVTEDERGAVGVPPPAAEYCAKTGYKITGDRCVFPDGTSCEQWSFYRAECGQDRSYCSVHGGRLSRQEQDMGGWTSVVAVCELNGKQCKEDVFFRTGKCE